MGLGRGEDRVEVGDLAGGHLDRAEGDASVRSSIAGQLRRRDGRDLEPRLGEEREEGGGELDLRDHDAAAGRQRGGDEADEAGDGGADRDAARDRCDEFANAARAPSVASLQPSQLVRPPRHSSSACCSASQPRCGGRP